MHFAFTDEQAMIAETAKAFFAEQATSERTRAAMAGTGVDEALWQAFTADLGLAGVAVPESEGGVGLGMVELAILAEEAGRHVAALPLLASVGLAIPAILAGGSAEQKERAEKGQILCWMTQSNLLDLFRDGGDDNFQQVLPAGTLMIGR